MESAYIFLLISLSLNSLPRQFAEKLPNEKAKKLDRAMGPCFKGENIEKCGEGFECDLKDNLCKKSSIVKKTSKKLTFLALSVRKKRQVGVKCNNGFNPASQCFVDNTCGYQPQYQCESGPQMKVCCPSNNPLLQQQQQPIGWPVQTGGCRTPGCFAGCPGGCQQQILPQAVPQQNWVPVPNVQAGGCPSFYQDIGQCYNPVGTCSTSGYGQCFGNRCCEPVTSTAPPTVANGCMYYVPQLGRSFDICTGNTKCINGQCVPAQSPVTPQVVTSSCIPTPCPNIYNHLNMCCWQQKRRK